MWFCAFLVKPQKDKPMITDSLLEPIDNAVTQAQFTDVYQNSLDASQIRNIYKAKQRCPLNTTDAITVRQRELDAVTQELGLLLGTYKSPRSGSVGNGIYTLTGSSASPRLPSCEAYAKILVLAASRIGANRVAQLLGDWILGKNLRVFECVLLKGLSTEGCLNPVPGMHLSTLPSNGDLLPRSLRLNPQEHWHEQFTGRAILSIEYETSAALYDPEVIQGNPPLPSKPFSPVNSDLSTVTFESFCRAISLTTNNHIDWFIHWHDYGDVEAFFLNPGFSSRRKEASNIPVISVGEESVRECLQTHSMLEGRRDLDLAIARWRRAKHARTIDEQLIELRIALESSLLNDDTGTSEKSQRIATRGAWLLGETPDQRKSYFETLRQVYSYASSVIHGGTPKIKKDRDLKCDITDAQNLCREAIVLLANSGKMLTSDDWLELILGQGTLRPSD